MSTFLGMIFSPLTQFFLCLIILVVWLGSARGGLYGTSFKDPRGVYILVGALCGGDWYRWSEKLHWQYEPTWTWNRAWCRHHLPSTQIWPPPLGVIHAGVISGGRFTDIASQNSFFENYKKEVLSQKPSTLAHIYGKKWGKKQILRSDVGEPPP